MKTLLVGLIYLGVSTMAQAQETSPVPNVFGALAYSENSSSYGWVIDAKSREEASQKALTQCKNKGCEVMLVLRNGCAAFAQNDKSRGWAIGDSLEEAERSAVIECQNYAKGPAICQVKASGCTVR